MKEMKKVLCTHMEPQPLAIGPWKGDSFPGVALPSTKALRKWVIVRYGDLFTCAMVADVGPWATDDDAYVFGDEKSRAETHKGRYCPLKIGSLALATVPDGNGGFVGVTVCNGAGIDLFPATAKALGIQDGDNVMVEWKFIDPPFNI